MTSPAPFGGPPGSGRSEGSDSAAPTERLPITSPPARPSAGGPPTRARAQAIAVLPEQVQPAARPVPEPAAEPVPEPEATSAADAPAGPSGLRRLLRRPELNRSTTLLLVLLGAVVLVAGGAFVGRFTAPRPAGPPVVDGVVESVSGDPGSTQLTVRTPDGQLVVFAATTTTVGAPRPGGLDALRPGDHVAVDSAIDPQGNRAARAVLVGGAP